MRQRAEDVRRDADRAAVAAQASQTRLEDLVGASYRVPRPGAFTVALGDLPGMSERLHATASLEQVQGRQQDLVAQADADRRRAEALLVEAEQLEADAAARERSLASEVERLRADAEQARDRLDAARERLEAQQAAARERRAAARASRSSGPVRDGQGHGEVRRPLGVGLRQRHAPRQRAVPAAGTNGLLLRADAAAAFNKMAAAGGMPCAGNSYRSYAQQVAVYAEKPSLAAVPGTSNHGWGVAVDFACGAERFGSSAYQWLKAHGPTYGWTHPSWAEPGGSRPEPWHWEYTG